MSALTAAGLVLAAAAPAVAQEQTTTDPAGDVPEAPGTPGAVTDVTTVEWQRDAAGLTFAVTAVDSEGGHRVRAALDAGGDNAADLMITGPFRNSESGEPIMFALPGASSPGCQGSESEGAELAITETQADGTTRYEVTVPQDALGAIADAPRFQWAVVGEGQNVETNADFSEFTLHRRYDFVQDATQPADFENPAEGFGAFCDAPVSDESDIDGLRIDVNRGAVFPTPPPAPPAPPAAAPPAKQQTGPPPFTPPEGSETVAGGRFAFVPEEQFETGDGGSGLPVSRGGELERTETNPNPFMIDKIETWEVTGGAEGARAAAEEDGDTVLRSSVRLQPRETKEVTLELSEEGREMARRKGGLEVKRVIRVFGGGKMTREEDTLTIVGPRRGFEFVQTRGSRAGESYNVRRHDNGKVYRHYADGDVILRT